MAGNTSQPLGVEAALPQRARPSTLNTAVRVVVDGKMFVLLVLLVLLFSLLNHRFFTLLALNTVARQMAILLVVSLGATFVLVQGMIDLSIGSTLAMGGVLCGWGYTHSGLTAAVILPLVGGVMVGLFNGFFVTVVRLPSFLVTLGGMSVVGGLALTFGHTYTTFDSKTLGFLGAGRLAGGFPVLCVFALGLLAILWFVQARTRFGRYSYAIGGGEAVSKLSGIPVGRYKMAAFVLSGFTAALAGILLAGKMQAGTSEMAGNFMLNGIAAICIGGTSLAGGIGGVHRTLVGSIIVTILVVGLNMVSMPTNWQTVITGAVVILGVYFTMTRDKSMVVK
jgi:ribose transport system permease protein/putative xylitol transport system permease protein